MAEATRSDHRKRKEAAWQKYDKDGDASLFLEEFADDIVYHIGSGPFAGDYTGRDAIDDLFSRLQRMTRGTARAKTTQVLYDTKAEHERAVAVAENRFKAGGEWHTTLFAHVAHIRGGKITELWTLSYDPDLPSHLARLMAADKVPGN